MARSECDVLADDIAALLGSVRRARRMGIEVQMPQRLTQACRELVAESDSAPDTPPIGVDNVPAAAVMSALPLRRALWHVLSPGEVFKVADVAERLAARGVVVTPAKVSNALGYWVDRGRLTRKARGLYRCSSSPD